MKDAPRNMLVFSEENKKATADLQSHARSEIAGMKDELMEMMNDEGSLASFLLSPFLKITNPENSIQFKLVKDPNINRVNELPLNKTIPVTLHGSLLTFRDTAK